MTSRRQVRIVIRGRLGERGESFFDEFDVISRRGQTELRGEIVDQAQLHGLLTRIRDLGLELEGVALEPAPLGRLGPATPSPVQQHPKTT